MKELVILTLILVVSISIYYGLVRHFLNKIKRHDHETFDPIAQRLKQIDEMLPLLSELLNKGVPLEQAEELSDQPHYRSSDEDQKDDKIKRQAITYRTDPPDAIDIDGNVLHLPITKKI